jgi:hypothetical protein
MAGNIRSGYPLPWFCKDCRGIGTRPRKCTAIVDPGERFFNVRSGKRRLLCHLSCRCHHYRFRISKSLPLIRFVHGVIQFSNLAVIGMGGILPLSWDSLLFPGVVGVIPGRPDLSWQGEDAGELWVPMRTKVWSSTPYPSSLMAADAGCRNLCMGLAPSLVCCRCTLLARAPGVPVLRRMVAPTRQR